MGSSPRAPRPQGLGARQASGARVWLRSGGDGRARSSGRVEPEGPSARQGGLGPQVRTGGRGSGRAGAGRSWAGLAAGAEESGGRDGGQFSGDPGSWDRRPSTHVWPL